MTGMTATAAGEPVVVDMTAPDFHEHAHDVYDRIRALSPVVLATLAPGGATGPPFWMITGHDAAIAALRDPSLASDPRSALSPEEIAGRPETRHEGSQASMLFSDPPEHTRLRRLVQAAFTPRFVTGLQPKIRRHTGHLLDRAERWARDGDGTVDLLDAFAYPLPISVIGDMIGYPQAWHDALHDFAVRAATASSQLEAPEADATAEIEGFARDVIALRGRDPGDDLVTRLSRPDDPADRLSPDELVATIVLLTAAGFETTASVIGSGTSALLSDPSQWSALRESPPLAAAVVEETLRCWGGVETAIMRFASAPTELAGRAIARGDGVLVFLAAANRDPARVRDPHRFDLHRRGRGHLGFGGGIHTCLGAALARAEGRTAFTGLVERWPDLELAVPAQELRWRPGAGLRGLRSLPVRPHPR